MDAVWWVDPGRVLQGIFFGEMPSLKNSRRLGKAWKRGGGTRPIIRKSEEATDFEAHVQQVVFRSLAARDGVMAGCTRQKDLGKAPLLVLEADVYVRDLLMDLDVELLLDCLQKSGILQNDRAIWEKHLRRHLTDDGTARVEFQIQAEESA